MACFELSISTKQTNWAMEGSKYAVHVTYKSVSPNQNMVILRKGT